MENLGKHLQLIIRAVGYKIQKEQIFLYFSKSIKLTVIIR